MTKKYRLRIEHDGFDNTIYEFSQVYLAHYMMEQLFKVDNLPKKIYFSIEQVEGEIDE